MDNTKSKLAAFFDNDEEESSFPQKEVDDQKRTIYTQGTVRKSKREKEKEAAEAKRKEEEENAAKAYAEFLDAFQGEAAEKKRAGSGFVKAGQSSVSVYPSFAAAKPQISRSRMFDDEPSKSPSPPPAAPKPKGKRAMDSFLEEIKREQADREARLSRHVTHGRSVTSIAAYEGQTGSKDRGDPQSSNVFVANLPPHVTEQSLGIFFARVGPVGSVKIMWPRGDATHGPGADMTASRRNKNAGLSGFVAFMKRKDAEAALRELDGFDWGGSILRVGWSKAVPVAAKPIGQEGQIKIAFQVEVAIKVSTPPLYEEEDISEQFIRTVAAEVKGHEAEYEDSLREREQSNPKYAFLKKDHRSYRFYRSLVDRTEPLEPEFDDEGYNSVYSTDSAEESERERGRKNELGKIARRRFEAMLRALSGRRGELARCMAFSLEHAEAAEEVADIIISSLVVDRTPVPRKVARLHLICDILHNSAAPLPMAWKFRQEFQSRLGLVFDHLSTIYHSFPGRITAETFKKQITSVIDIWEDWIVFPPDFTSELRARLEGQVKPEAEEQEEAPVTEVKETTSAFTSKFKASSFKPAEEVANLPPAVESIDDGEPMDEGSDIDGEPVDDVDGVPLDDVDGEPLDLDMDGEPMEDVDGEPLNNEDVDGEPMEDDIDGAPMTV
ncbi:hypothetical protein OBBRIDRAFT_831241 [Obba rivulosa]|uniref:U2 snRNP-associated SURP motif-containing protein n=1 Tax=Obba rivulosa TaxID=1052685 RepID=A0A8E2DST7_9APHY|nr:hypothetical protein OBBRIDRAFT_831241 [Obba rivulosa]